MTKGAKDDSDDAQTSLKSHRSNFAGAHTASLKPSLLAMNRWPSSSRQSNGCYNRHIRAVLTNPTNDEGSAISTKCDTSPAWGCAQATGSPTRLSNAASAVCGYRMANVLRGPKTTMRVGLIDRWPQGKPLVPSLD